jgi:manganese/iron transport system ATP-binding protein
VKTETAIIHLLEELRDEGRILLVSTHNLGSVPQFCDRAILIKGTVLAQGADGRRLHPRQPQAGVWRRAAAVHAGGDDLHDDDDSRAVTVLTDDERPFVIYGDREPDEPKASK